jgi:integrase
LHQSKDAGLFQQIYNPLVPVALHGPLLTDQSGLPRYWSAIWSAVSSGQLAASTHTKKLRYIEDLYAHADRLLGKHALDDALGSLNETALAEILESWFVSIRNRPTIARSDEKRWQMGLAFVTSTVTWLSTSGTSNDRLQRIEQRIHRLSTLYSQLHVHKTAQAEIIRSLPASTVEWLYQTLDPASAENPFERTRKRWCVFVGFVLMLHQGLRRGEMLLLPADVIKSECDHKQQRTRHWLSVRESKYAESDPDPRYSRPQIKTVHSRRQVPVSELTATLVQSYAENYRGRPKHSYLLNAQSNRPLSTESLTSAFKRISDSMPPRVLNDLRQRTGKESISPQDLRHTCAVVRLHQLLEQGDSMNEALQKLRTFFGWSKNSQMPLRYARAVFEDRLAGVWNNAFDDRVTLLRALSRER